MEMDLVKNAYEVFVELSTLKMLLLIYDKECKKACKRDYSTLKLTINHLKNKIDEIDYLIEKYCNDEKIDDIEILIEEIL